MNMMTWVIYKWQCRVINGGNQETQRQNHPWIQEPLLPGLPLILGESTCLASKSQALAGSTKESKTDLLCALSLISPLEEMGCREWSGDNCARIRQPNFSRPEEMNRIQPINVYEGSTCPVLWKVKKPEIDWCVSMDVDISHLSTQQMVHDLRVKQLHWWNARRKAGILSAHDWQEKRESSDHKTLRLH